MSSELAPAAARADLYGKRILVVEDDDRLYCALKDTLQDAGCEVFGTCTHVSGLWDAVPNTYVDAALIGTPQGSVGLSQFASLARQLTERGVPILLMTSRTAQRMPGNAQHSSLVRPFTEQDLIYGIAAALSTAGLPATVCETS